LLFRAGPQNIFQPRKDDSSSVIVDSATLFELQTLTGHAKAFINVDKAALLSGAARLLPPNRIAVEMLETVPPTPEVIQACTDLCGSGYTLALDDFSDHPKREPLVRLAIILKVDFRDSDADARYSIAKRHRSNGVHLLAEKVETQEEMKQAREFGYTYFQGFFFCKPVMVEGKDIPGSKLTYQQLLKPFPNPCFLTRASKNY